MPCRLGYHYPCSATAYCPALAPNARCLCQHLCCLHFRLCVRFRLRLCLRFSLPLHLRCCRRSRHRPCPVAANSLANLPSARRLCQHVLLPPPPHLLPPPLLPPPAPPPPPPFEYADILVSVAQYGGNVQNATVATSTTQPCHFGCQQRSVEPGLHRTCCQGRQSTGLHMLKQMLHGRILAAE